MVRLQGVKKTYPGSDSPVLADVHLHVGAGDFVFLTGNSGAGKTTMLRLILGDALPNQGRVVVAGCDMGRLRQGRLARIRRRLGVVFQDFRLMPESTVYENVALALKVNGLRRAGADSAIMEALGEVGLENQALKVASSLSGGEQQRTAVARALVRKPELILADEPTGNLDPENTGRIMELLTRAHQHGATVLLATHDPSLPARQPGARLVCLSHGRLEEQ